MTIILRLTTQFNSEILVYSNHIVAIEQLPTNFGGGSRIYLTTGKYLSVSENLEEIAQDLRVDTL